MGLIRALTDIVKGLLSPDTLVQPPHLLIVYTLLAVESPSLEYWYSDPDLHTQFQSCMYTTHSLELKVALFPNWEAKDIG